MKRMILVIIQKIHFFFFDPFNKKVIGKMKDEVKGKKISQFVGFKSKMYSLIIFSSEESKKAKRVNKNVV